MGLVERNALGHEISAHLGLQLGVRVFVLGLVLVHEREKLVRNGSGSWNSGWSEQGPLLFSGGNPSLVSLSRDLDGEGTGRRCETHGEGRWKMARDDECGDDGCREEAEDEGL